MNPGVLSDFIIRIVRLSVVLAAALLLSACGSHTYHVVKRGDTLYSIGWWYGIDHHQLARWNRLSPPYTLSVGQRVFLADRKDFPADPFVGYDRESWKREISDKVKRGDTAPLRPAEPAKKAVSISRDSRLTAPGIGATAIKWRWPAKGRLVQNFRPGKKGNSGIKIAGGAGDMVHAAAGGKIVYTGDALLGYGNLIIIKHNTEFLSAYGHVKRALVKEGDFIKAGQRIAEMGSTGTNRVMLHFEIRKAGVPIDPIPYLPDGDSSRG